MEIIKVENLTKKYRHPVKSPGITGALKHLFSAKYNEKVAVNNISFTISEGETVAYLGKNGAGKSTTIKMLTGILCPTSGSVLVDGIEPYKKRIEYTKKIGVVFGQRTQLWLDIPIFESLKLIRDIYEIPNDEFEKKLDSFTDMLDLNDFLHLPARNVSLGQRMRADIVAALLHNPKILFLDEPTIGLDIEAKEKIRAFISYLNKTHRTTVILTTHDLEDIEHICSRLILINDGKLLYDGSIEKAKNKYTHLKRIYLQVEDIVPEIHLILNVMKEVKLESVRDNEIVISYNRFKTTAAEIVSEFMKYTKVHDIGVEEPTLENVLKLIYSTKL